MNGALYNWGGSFLVWRGVAMKRKYIKEWEQQLKMGKKARLQSPTSCSRRLTVAVNFVVDNMKKKKDEIVCPVLFVFASQNYKPPYGIYINNTAYTPFPMEDELLLMEGTMIRVLDVQKRVKIKNNHPCMN